ncbi:MAG: DinB family protein [Bryobacteraceae bacterium]
MREHLVYLLDGGGAHIDFDAAVTGLPAALRGVRPSGLPHTPWQLVEHMRIAQWDILEFCRKAKHVSPKWPEGYWPATAAPPDDGAWDRSVKAFRADMATIRRMVKNPKMNLHARIPHGTGQTILREALLVADHNAYHLGQLVLTRRLLGAWK